VQIAFFIKTLLNPYMLTIEEVVGHLHAVEERLDGDLVSADGQLLAKNNGRTRGSKTAARAPARVEATAAATMETPTLGAPAACLSGRAARCRHDTDRE
jgi:hypothetical protein